MDEKELTRLLVINTKKLLARFALRHSVGLALYRNQNPNAGSGTLLKISNKYFIITAAHCISNLDLKDIKIAYREKSLSERFEIIKMGYKGGSDNDPSDIAYLEIKEPDPKGLPAEFLTLGNLRTNPFYKEKLGYLFGFPSQLIPIEEVFEGTFRFRSLGLLTIIKDARAYDNIVDPIIDCVFSYPKSGLIGEETNFSESPDPGGLSGGSMWIYEDENSTDIVGSHNAKLVGITKSWIPKQRIIIGNRIIYLLNLLQDDYPELSDEISKAKDN